MHLNGLRTGIAVNLVSKQKAGVGPGQVLIDLASGRLLRRLGLHVRHIIDALPTDPALPLEEALPRLLVVVIQLKIRLETFCAYPCKVYELSATMNPAGYLKAILDFVDEEDVSVMDPGFTRALWDEAHNQGSTVAAVDFLSKPSTQLVLTELFHVTHATSLDVERKHAVDKKSEHSKVVARPGKCSPPLATSGSIMASYAIKLLGVLTLCLPLLQHFLGHHMPST